MLVNDQKPRMDLPVHERLAEFVSRDAVSTKMRLIGSVFEEHAAGQYELPSRIADRVLGALFVLNSPDVSKRILTAAEKVCSIRGDSAEGYGMLVKNVKKLLSQQT